MNFDYQMLGGLNPIPGALWDRAVATLFPVWRLRVREMCIPRGPPARLLFSQH